MLIEGFGWVGLGVMSRAVVSDEVWAVIGSLLAAVARTGRPSVDPWTGVV